MRIVFRADTREPASIFDTGFQPRFSGGIKIHSGGQMTGGISTSKDLGVAIRYAALYDGWVYVIWLDGGIDVLGYLAKHKLRSSFQNAVSQMEIAAPNVARQHIIAARHCRQTDNNAEMNGPVVINPNCVVREQDKSLGIAFLDSNVTVSKDYH